MALQERKATAVWKGGLADGKGRFSLGSGAMSEIPVTWQARTEGPGGKTSPEELIAAAHASCFSMALSGALAKAGSPPEELHVEATCSLDKVEGGFKITTMEIKVRGKVPGMDEAAFQQTARDAGKGCPVSKALTGNVDISVDAALAK
ncbi:MAG: OsmC family protein [Gemmatimonadota bacterium]